MFAHAACRPSATSCDRRRASSRRSCPRPWSGRRPGGVLVVVVVLALGVIRRLVLVVGGRPDRGLGVSTWTLGSLDDCECANHAPALQRAPERAQGRAQGPEPGAGVGVGVGEGAAQAVGRASARAGLDGLGRRRWREPAGLSASASSEASPRRRTCWRWGRQAVQRPGLSRRRARRGRAGTWRCCGRRNADHRHGPRGAIDDDRRAGLRHGLVDDELRKRHCGGPSEYRERYRERARKHQSHGTPPPCRNTYRGLIGSESGN